jgi:hypothetical protein
MAVTFYPVCIVTEIVGIEPGTFWALGGYVNHWTTGLLTYAVHLRYTCFLSLLTLRIEWVLVDWVYFKETDSRRGREHGIELLGFMKGGRFVNELSDY